MTKKLASDLISHYEMCIKKIKKMSNKENIRNYLFDMDIFAGICACAKNKFWKECCYDDDFVKKNKMSDSDYWSAKPITLLDDKAKLIKSLRVRVDILKTFK